jgi:hypothetical protein
MGCHKTCSVGFNAKKHDPGLDPMLFSRPLHAG